jgi:hypothetical protein
MSSQTSNGLRLSTVDFVFSLLDDKRSPQDFSVIFHLPRAPAIENLRAGAKSARNVYPKSASHICGKEWACRRELNEGLDILSPQTISEATKTIEQFVEHRFDLHNEFPVKQILLSNDWGETKLVTSFHHAAADGLSAAMWLGHQLSVAYGLEQPQTRCASFSDLQLRRLETRVRRSQYAYNKASDQLWTSRPDCSGARRWLTIGFAASELRKACRQAGGFTYSDLLATCTLEVFRQWNRKHDTSDDQRIGLWLPMNIRRQSSIGFGNGTSRIRLYARYPATAPLAVKCQEVREQISWSTKHGEWVVPEIPSFTSLPRWIVRPLLRSYLNRPFVDMATGVFSHSDRWTNGSSEAFQHVDKIECVGLLHPRQCLAINGATLRGQTWLTFTYDPSRLNTADVEELTEMYRQQIALAAKEFE